MPGYRFFAIEQTGPAVVARAVDSYLQGTTLAELWKLELQEIGERDDVQEVIVDFREVKMISSSIVSSLLGIKRQMGIHEKSLKLCGMSDSLRHVFRTLNMDGTVFDIFEDVPHALNGQHRGDSYYDVCGRVSPPDEESA